MNHFTPSLLSSELARFDRAKRKSPASRIKRLAQKFMAYRKARRELEPAPVDDFFNRDRCDARFAHFD